MRDLPDKDYYTIGEVSELLGVAPHVLRYWEREFPQLRPEKGRGGMRRYRKSDLRTAIIIKDLLHTHGYTIRGARRRLASPDPDPGELEAARLRAVLSEVRRGLVSLRDELRKGVD